MVTLGKMCTATKGGQLTQGNIPLFYKSLQVTNFLSLIVLIPYLCTPPSLVTSALSHCVPVTGISSSSVPPVLFTDTLRHASMVPETGWIHVQMVLLSHPHALPDTADEHGGTHACRHAQRHQLKLLATGLQGQTVPPQHPFKTDRITRHPSLLVVWRHTHAPAWLCLYNFHTSALHEPSTAAGWGNLSAGPRDSSSSADTAVSVALVANGESATANLWSDTSRGKGERKRTLWTWDVLAFLSGWEEGGYIRALPVAQGLTVFLSSL